MDAKNSGVAVGRWPALIRVVLALLLTTIVAVPAFAQDMKPLSSYLAERIAASNRKTVAVVDFTDLQGNVTELGRFLAEELSVALAGNARTFEVIDRTHLKSILQENKFATTGLIDPQTARKLGQIAGVDALVTGTITAFGDSVRLSAKVLDTSTAKIIGASTADVPKTKAIEELLGRGIGSPASASTSATTASAKAPSLSTQDPVGISISETQDGFSFEVKSCQRSGSAVTCRLLITNQEEDRNLTVFASRYNFGYSTWGVSRAFDQMGNEYEASTIGLGNKTSSAVGTLMVRGVPTTAYIKFENVSPDAIKFALVEINSVFDVAGNRKSFIVKVRNIPLVR